MSDNQLKFYCNISLEAEDVSQSRILSTASFVKNIFARSSHPQLQAVGIEDESDLEEFVVRLYLEAKEETVCTEQEQAEMLAPLLADLLSEIAQANSYLEIEGDFSVEYQNSKEAYRCISQSGDAFCSFEEM